MTLKPIQRRSLSDEIFEQLKSQILQGAFGVGTPLPSERRLCEMLGVNRGALREALKRLEQARLVSIQHGGTTKVQNFMKTAGLDLLTALLFKEEGKIDTRVARSIVEIRSALAPDIVRLCAQRADAELKKELAEVVDRMEEAKGDLPALQQLAMEFWSLAVEGSQNVAYRLCYNTLQESYTKFAHLLLHVLEEELSDLKGYRAIAAAVRAGDTAMAERRAHELIRKGGDRIIAILENVARMKGEEE
jgi:DNA-binding FadR family transcriptional regulator